MALPSKALVSAASGLDLFDDPASGKRLAIIHLDTGFVFDGNNVSLSADVIIDPADSSAVIRQKFINSVIAAALSQYGQVLAKEDIIVPSYTTGLSTVTSETRADTFTVAGDGAIVDTSLRPLSVFSLTVSGEDQAAESWDVRLEGSLDGTNFTEILRHTHLTGDLQTMYSGSNRNPCLFFRSRCVDVVIGSATSIKATILGVP